MRNAEQDQPRKRRALCSREEEESSKTGGSPPAQGAVQRRARPQMGAEGLAHKGWQQCRSCSPDNPEQLWEGGIGPCHRPPNAGLASLIHQLCHSNNELQAQSAKDRAPQARPFHAAWLAASLPVSGRLSFQVPGRGANLLSAASLSDLPPPALSSAGGGQSLKHARLASKVARAKAYHQLEAAQPQGAQPPQDPCSPQPGPGHAACPKPSTLSRVTCNQNLFPLAEKEGSPSPPPSASPRLRLTAGKSPSQLLPFQERPA